MILQLSGNETVITIFGILIGLLLYVLLGKIIVRHFHSIGKREADMEYLIGLKRMELHEKGISIPYTEKERMVLKLIAANKNEGINYFRTELDEAVFVHPDILAALE